MTVKTKKSRKSRFYSVLLTSLFLLASASASYFWSLNNKALSDDLGDLRAESIAVQREFRLEKKVNGLYQSRYTYVSELQDTVFPYNAVGLKWEGNIPAGTSFEVSVRGSDEDIWHLLDPETDGPSLEVNSSDIKFLTSPRSKLQYRVMLSTDNVYRTPVINSLELHYFNYGRKQADEKQAANLLAVLKAEAADDLAPRIITREEWGANEALRVYHSDNPPAKIISEGSDDEDAAQYANELIVVKEIDQNEKGQDLTWPVQYPLNVTHIVVHHTAMDYTTSLAESIAKVRDIYYWHTIVKGWGDVGYNYLIDSMGNIFEGRAGSAEGAVGAHAAGSNVGSVGIALMGDYRPCEDKYAAESEEYLKCLAGDPDFAAHDLTPAAEQALVDLIAYKSAQYGINPMGKSAWRGKIRPNILGHRDVRKTACPGQNIYDRLPEVRALAAQKYFELLPNVTQLNFAEKFAYKASNKALYALEVKGVPNRISAEPGETIKLPIRVQNTGTMDILKNSYFESLQSYGTIEMLKGQREQLDESIKPGASGIFQLEFKLSAQASGTYTLAFYPVLNLRQELKDQVVKIMLDVDNQVAKTSSGASTFLDELAGVLGSKRSSELAENPNIRVRISKFAENNAQVSATAGFSVSFGEDKKFNVKAGEILKIRRDGAALEVEYQDALQTTTKPIRVSGTVLTVDNMQAPPAWNPDLNDNAFRNTLEFRSQGAEQNLLMINELPLEDYLKGIAEVPNGEPLEKNKAMSVIARGYAYQYLVADNRKYPGQPFDASDDPETFQKYLGYNFESRNDDWQKAVQETYGQMLTFDGKVIKTPYFNQSDGRTRSAEEVWGWTDTPWLQSVPDPFCKGLELKGHGVGLSGCGATEAAKRGKTYAEILQYYYKGVELERIY